jgi:hypothetical protein
VLKWDFDHSAEPTVYIPVALQKKAVSFISSTYDSKKDKWKISLLPSLEPMMAVSVCNN